MVQLQWTWTAFLARQLDDVDALKTISYGSSFELEVKLMWTEVELKGWYGRVDGDGMWNGIVGDNGVSHSGPSHPP